MSDKHETCYSCELCGRYFGTYRSQVEHNKATHEENCDFTESEDMLHTKSTEGKNHQKEKKQKNKKKKPRNKLFWHYQKKI